MVGGSCAQRDANNRLSKRRVLLTPLPASNRLVPLNISQDPAPWRDRNNDLHPRVYPCIRRTRVTQVRVFLVIVINPQIPVAFELGYLEIESASTYGLEVLWNHLRI